MASSIFYCTLCDVAAYILLYIRLYCDIYSNSIPSLIRGFDDGDIDISDDNCLSAIDNSITYGKSSGFDSWVRPSNLSQIRSKSMKSSIFRPV